MHSLSQDLEGIHTYFDLFVPCKMHDLFLYKNWCSCYFYFQPYSAHTYLLPACAYPLG